MENPLSHIKVPEVDMKDYRTGRKIPKWVKRFFQILLILFITPFLLFQIPWVQQKAAKELTAYLSKELKTQVSIDKVYVGIFNRLTFDDFYMADLHGDTLVYAGALDIKHSGLFNLLFRRFKIESLTLNDADVHISRAAGEEAQNFQFVVDYFSKNQQPGPQKPAKPFQINLRHAYLNNVHFLKPDFVKGEKMDVFVKKTEAHFDRFDLLGKRIDFASLAISEPDFKLFILPAQPLHPESQPVQLTAEKVPGEVVDTNLLRITIKDFDLDGGKFALNNIRKEPERTTPADVLNLNYLNVFDIEIHINDFSFSDLHFAGEVEKIAMQEESGFVIENLSAKDAKLSCEGMELYGLDLRTPYTHIGDTLVFSYNAYPAWENFENDVRMDIRFQDSHIALRDIMAFVPGLRNNLFFEENSDLPFEIEGIIKGKVNSLDGKNLKIAVGKDLELEGSFRSNNLAVKDEQFLDLNLKRLHTNVSTLRKLIPGFRPPANVDKLGTLDFNGKFLGFFNDFVADGNLHTNIGSAKMFMNLKLNDNKNNAAYFGDLYLKNFDLGAWTGDPNFGKITFSSHVKEGRGLSSSRATAKLEATIDSFTYKGYKYKNVSFDGKLEKNLLDGNIVAKDKNLDFNFKGVLDFTKKTPALDFAADIRRLDLKPLNISKNDLQFFGKVNMNLTGTTLSNVLGQAQVFDFKMVKNKQDTLSIDTATVVSALLPGNEKLFTVNSTLGSANIQGQFDIEKIPDKILQFIVGNYPTVAHRIGLKPKETNGDTSRFDFSVQLLKLQNLMAFFDKNIQGFDESVIKGSYNGFENTMSAEVEVPLWKYQNIGFQDVYFKTELEGNEGSVVLGVAETALSETQKLPPVFLNGTIYKDTLEFLLISTNFFKILDNININGKLTLEGEDAYRISFKQSDLIILNQLWDIDTDNYLRIGQGSVETSNFILSHADQKISLSSVRGEGLELRLQNFLIDSLEYIQNLPEKYHLSGVADLHVRVKDLFKFQGIETLLRVNDLTMNGDNFGTLRLDASAPSLKETFGGFLAIEGDSTSLTIDGYYNPPTYEVKPYRLWIKNEPNYFDFDVAISKYPVKILNYFVADVSELEGSVSAEKIKFFGKPERPELSGEVAVNNAAFKLKALQTTYRIPKGLVLLNNSLIDGNNSLVLDRFGNKAYVTGGITHDHLKNFGLNVTVSTAIGKPFLGLETTSRDNPIFYGTALGTGFVRFTGDFTHPNLYVSGTTMKGTHMYLPMTGNTVSKDVSFINFPEPTANPDEPKSVSPLAEIRGLNMEYDLTLTPEAQMDVIFDKAWGDVLQGTGRGNLKVIMTRDGRFDMYGDYVVESGKYLFTMMNIGVNKPFIVEPGGIISWSGDPYQAQINVSAVYEGLNTSVNNFIQEYINSASSDIQSLARTSTPVNLKMKLKGNLLSPEIDFDIDFPSLTSELRNYAENKMRTIRQDPNELNRQVFGLLVLGQFLPSGYSIQAGDVGINTVSEMLSSQLSIYITEFVSELFTGKGLIQGIDFDISYNRYSGGSVDLTDYRANELRGQLKVTLSDRISVRGGLNFDVSGSGSTSTNSGLVAGEFIIEYTVTKDRRLKLKAYNSSEPDIGGGSRNKIGVGLSFRKEFDTLSELLGSKK